MSVQKALFIVNGDKELEINRFEVKKIPEFKALFDRAQGIPQDPNNKKEYLACAEMVYIFHVYHIGSILSNLEIEVRKEKAKIMAKLPERWKEDKVLEKAVEAFKREFKLTAAGNAYSSAEKSYYQITKDTSELLDYCIEIKSLIDKKVGMIKSKRIGDKEFNETANEFNTLLENLAKNQKTILTNIKSFPDIHKNVKQLETIFLESGGSLKVPVGGGELGRREE